MICRPMPWLPVLVFGFVTLFPAAGPRVDDVPFLKVSPDVGW